MILVSVIVFIGNILAVIYAAVNNYLDMVVIMSFTAGMLFLSILNLVICEIKDRKELKKDMEAAE